MRAVSDFNKRNEDEIDLRQVLASLRRKWHYFLLSALFLSLAAFLYIHFTLPVYEATSSVLIKDSKNKTQNIEDILTGDLFGNVRNIATEIGILWRILLPLSKPVLATFALFYAVGIWNDFMSPLLYLSDNSKWTLQMYLRQVTASSDLLGTGNVDPNYIPPEQGIKFAVIVVATLPILIFYPFLQKHFAKGMLIGSVKG